MQHEKAGTHQSRNLSAADAFFERRGGRYACFVVLVVVAVFFAAVRFHTRRMPLERDEGEFAYMGQLLLHRIPPYKFAFTMKLPGTCVAYAAIMAAFGQTAAGIRLGLIAVTTLCALFVFLLGKRLYDLRAGTVAAVTYLFLAIRPGVLGQDAHATHFVMLMALPGLLLLLQAIDQDRVVLLFSSGLLLGLALLMKQPGIFFAGFAGCYWLWGEWKKGARWKRLAVRGAALTAGIVCPYALVCLWMERAGVFDQFWFWTWTYARAYGSSVSLAEGWERGLSSTLPWAVRPFVLWEIALAGFAAPLWSRYARRHGGFLTSLFAASCLAVCAGFYFRPHYFILLLPVVALCTGVAVDCAERELHRLYLSRFAALPPLLFGIAYVASIHGQWKTFVSLDPDALSRQIHEDQPYADAVTVSDFIKARAVPKDEIGVIGSEPEICFYTRLRCASSYIYMYPLMERHRFARQMQADVLRELQASRPRFVVYVDDSWSWDWAPTLVQNRAFFDQAWSFAHDGYELVDEVPLAATRTGTAHLWGDRPEIYVFQRKEP